MQEQVGWRLNDATPTCESLNQMIKQNGLKAEAAGINFVMNFPGSIVADMDDQVEQLKRVLGEENETETE